MPRSKRGGSDDRPSRNNRRSRKNRPSRKRVTGFVAIDGESVDVQGEHTYVLLCSSDGENSRHLDDKRGISTAECFEFVLEVHAQSPNKQLVAFGLGYDVNMWLRDLTRAELHKLWSEQRLTITLANGVEYRLEWIPGKSFAVCRSFERKWARISDVFGFFQMSFVKSLEKWDVPDIGGHIARMKGERGTFKLKDLEAIRAYCIAECELLVELMSRLGRSLAEADLSPSRWVGAGSVAAAMLARQGVKHHRVHDKDFPGPIYDAIMHAYFGGRTEVFLQGKLDNVVNYDLCSAYPSEALKLPSLFGALWHASNVYDPSVRHGLWHCEWVLDKDDLVMPFPVRRSGSIFYPQNGRGWYHAKEVKAAKAIYGDRIHVDRGYILTPICTDKPFDFIRATYELRATLKAQGHASEKALKLGLNSLYGKLAQGIGSHGRTPPFQSFYWAGAITAGTRARLLDLASTNIGGVVSVATDGIVFSGDPDLVVSSELGGLEKTEYREIFVAQPGIYRAITRDGEEVLRTRGFFIKEIDYEDLERGWGVNGPNYVQRGVCKCGHRHTGSCSRCGCPALTFPSRFVGLGSALMRADELETWRTWAPSDRQLKLYSSRKSYRDGVYKSRCMRLYPTLLPDEEADSEIYVPKGRPLGQNIGEDSPDYIQGLEQPMEDD